MWYCRFVNVLLKQHRGKGNSVFFFSFDMLYYLEKSNKPSLLYAL